MANNNQSSIPAPYHRTLKQNEVALKVTPFVIHVGNFARTRKHISPLTVNIFYNRHNI